MDGYYEDLAVGDTEAFGSYEVTAEEITEFAGRYDPQPFHVDSEAAEASLFGGLIASGWHTGAICMRLLVDNQLNDSRAMGAIGVDDLRWPTAVRPGDTLRVETEVRDKEPWRPGIGLVHSGATVFNQGDETVMTMTGLVLFERRDREAND
jgi:acyl dehydratase